MKTPACHFLLISHGAPTYAMEAAYAILCLRANGRFDGAIHVVTDHTAELQKLLGEAHNIHYLHLSSERKLDFISLSGYVHRLKPQAIAWATRQIADKNDTVIFLDTDTAVLNDIQPLLDHIAAGKMVLNEYEGPANCIPNATRSQRRAGEFFERGTLQIEGVEYPLDPKTALWNSGVIGFKAHQVDGFDETTQWIDAIWPLLPIHTVEQVAFSAVMHAKGVQLVDSGNTLFHYHWFKEFRADLKAFFEHLGPDATFAERLALSQSIRPDVRVLPKTQFLKKPKWLRSILRRMGRDWKPLPYPWTS
jgi:hypothetical protein